jgi:hypothetical protein
MLLDMQDTATRRRDNIIELPEIFYKQIVTTLCQMFKTGIGHGLATAGLLSRINHLAPEFFQQLKCSDSYLGIKLIDITGYE